jgi:heme/copper-type cytochrome/quinol oxidase subunit 2
LHIKLFTDLHKNLIALPKITNYSFDSYCLSDYTLKSKYLAPKILLKNLQMNMHFTKNLYNLNTINKYIFNNPELAIDKLSKFKTFRISRLLETSKALILPTGTVIRALVTASDVIHS